MTPWTYTGDEDGDFVVWDASKFIANIGSSRLAPMSADPKNEMVAFDIEQANARLIAAAPEMLEALESLLVLIDRASAGVQFSSTLQQINKAQAVIRKAKGEL